MVFSVSHWALEGRGIEFLALESTFAGSWRVPTLPWIFFFFFFKMTLLIGRTLSEQCIDLDLYTGSIVLSGKTRWEDKQTTFPCTRSADGGSGRWRVTGTLQTMLPGEAPVLATNRSHNGDELSNHNNRRGTSYRAAERWWTMEQRPTFCRCKHAHYKLTNNLHIATIYCLPIRWDETCAFLLIKSIIVGTKLASSYIRPPHHTANNNKQTVVFPGWMRPNSGYQPFIGVPTSCSWTPCIVVGFSVARGAKSVSV